MADNEMEDYKDEARNLGTLFAKNQYDSSRRLLGKSFTEVRDQQVAEYEAFSEALSSYEGDINPWYGGTVDLVGGVYGKITAVIAFPSGDWQYKGNFWGAGVGYVKMSGGGPWGASQVPVEGQEMSYEVSGVVAPVGAMQIFWGANGGVVGSFVGGGGGAGVFVGGGKGTWNKMP